MFKLTPDLLPVAIVWFALLVFLVVLYRLVVHDSHGEK